MPSRKKPPLLHRENVIFVLVAVAFGFLLLIPYLHGRWRLADDAYMAYLQRYTLQERILKFAHQWQYWSLNIGLGQPAALDAGATLFYPIQVLWGLMVGWSETSYVYYLLLHLAAGAWIAASCGRVLGLSVAGSLLFATAYTGNGYVMGTLSNPNLMFPYLFWPLLISGLVELHGPPERVRAGARKAAIGAVLLEVTSYPLLRILFVGLTAIGYWLLARQKGTWFKGIRWKPLLICIGIALLCTFPEWIATLPVIKLADRLSNNIYDEYTYNSPANFLVLATAFLPGLFLRRDVYQIGMLWLERTWWVGSITMAMIGTALSYGVLSLRKLQMPGFLALFAFLFAMGGHSFVREASAMALGPLEHLRHSDYARCIVMGFLAFLGGWGLTQLEAKAGAEPKKDRRQWVLVLWAAFFVLAAVFAVQEDGNLIQVQPAQLYTADSAGWKIQFLHTSFYLLLAYTVFSMRIKLLEKYSWAYLIVLIQILSMGDAAYAFRRLVAEEKPLRPVDTFTVQSPHPNERSMKYWGDTDDWLAFQGNKVVFWAYTAPHPQWRSDALNDPKTQPLLGTLASCQDHAFDVTAGALTDAGLSCAGENFQIERYFGDRIVLTGSGPSPALMVVHDLYDPSWRASVNGEERPIYPAFRYFKGIRVPAGNWRVEFDYESPFFPLAWWISAAGFILLVWMPKRWFESGPRRVALRNSN